jgi:hypothetical protein
MGLKNKVQVSISTDISEYLNIFLIVYSDVPDSILYKYKSKKYLDGDFISFSTWKVTVTKSSLSKSYN